MASDKKARYRNYLANAFMFVLTLALIAGAVELYVRLVEDDGMQFDLEMWKYAKSVKMISGDPLIGHEHRPHADAFLMGVRVTTDGAGFRDEEIPVEKRPGSTRIMMLGDSVLFGWGVNQDETVSTRLKQAWRQAGHDIDVINGGVGNYNTIMEVEFFLTRGYRFKPDVVVLNYFINDAEPIPRYDYSFIERVSAAWVYYGSRLDIVERELNLGRQTDWRSYYSGLYDDAHNPGGWRNVELWIRKLASYCRDNGIKLLIVNYPELRVLDPYPFPEVQHRLAALAADLELPYLDLLDPLRGEEPASLWVTPPDPHPNGHAHALFARAIRAWIEREGLVH
jgi:lysophospholipase L1-like esterase